MIKIERGNPPTETIIDKRREEVLRKIRELAESGELRSAEFKTTLWSNPKVKNFLHESQHGKCCYCERTRDQKDFDVEHFRPKAEVKEIRDHPGYWWLAYSWENLLVACKACNQKKSSHFPLKDERKRAYGENCNLGEEEPFLINPLEEEPELFIEYDIRETGLMVKALGKCERGRKTVNELTGINDRKVMEERADKLKDYRVITLLLLDEREERRSLAKKRLQEYVSPCHEFSGFAKFYFRKDGCLK